MKVDIIIPTWNLPELVRECIRSIYAHTEYPFGLVIVDNASADPAKSYLESVAQAHDNVTLIRNEENLGFVRAVNKGIAVSKAPYVCLLNNDTEVTKGWLAEMVKVAQENSDVGIVNANSNTLGCKPRIGQGLAELSQELKQYSGRFSELAWATGFCMLIKREVIDKIGLFDERYGMGNFEDADFCKRAQARGYLSVCASASYVYHRERQSFSKVREFDSDFQRLRKMFFAKWGQTRRLLYVFSRSDTAAIEKTGQQILKTARGGNVIWIFLKDKNDYRLRHHSNVYVFALPRGLFNIISLWRIIKRKKRFDTIYIDDRKMEKRLKLLKPIHRAEVIYAG